MTDLPPSPTPLTRLESLQKKPYMYHTEEKEAEQGGALNSLHASASRCHGSCLRRKRL
jgi:hypothetical protein